MCLCNDVAVSRLNIQAGDMLMVYSGLIIIKNLWHCLNTLHDANAIFQNYITRPYTQRRLIYVSLLIHYVNSPWFRAVVSTEV